MLAILLNTPITDDDWSRFSFHHRTSHELIVQAIMKQKNKSLPFYQIDPIPPSAPTQWLQNNQLYHSDMNSALGVPGSDIEDVNLADERQKQAWVYLHYQEHLTAEQKLGISS